MSENRSLSSRLINQFLAGVERVGNALPHPASLFGILAGFVVLLSWIFSTLQVTVAHPATGEIVEPVNLISQYGDLVAWIIPKDALSSCFSTQGIT